MFRIGILGGGGISETHARAAQAVGGIEIVAFAGRNVESLRRLAAKFGGVPYTNLVEFFRHKPMDAVIIGSPSALHSEQGIAAAERGLHVLVEKPIDVTVERADALIAACERADVKLAVCYQDRFAPDSVRLKQFIDRNGLGKILLVTSHVKWYRPPEYYSTSGWRGKPEFDGGGALMNQGVHTIDLLLWLLGDVKSVFALSRTSLHDIESEDTLVATIEFANGAVGTLEAATSAFPGYERRVEITGSEGTIIFKHDRIVAADLRSASAFPGGLSDQQNDTNRSANSPIVSDVSGHKSIIQDFLHAIRSNTVPRCDGREGRRSVALVQAIYKSAELGKPLNL
ncbi:MAG TPA: Gfo/Idh/MocA family oxidoreductase [Pyrinomonadaceae bacterium]|nr:Gfo/Idh/MocA family oxidoreductase [Pyrinomonadaceae bacterium]